ncbi:MAG: hypothetical protein KC457_29870 [Myxococcales bacterium]|nr:hypothetical protein [Myxococcales bacterium]
MGNVHSLLQVRPIVSHEGVALPVHPDQHEVFWERMQQPLPSYMHAHRTVPSFSIHNVNIGSQAVRDPERASSYLILAAGGKWGYGDDFWARIEDLAPLLEDARWYFDDEYTGFVEEFRIDAGVLSRRMVVDEGGQAIDYVLETHADDVELIIALKASSLADNVAGDWIFGDDGEAAAELLALRPDDVRLQLLAVDVWLSSKDYARALARVHELQVATDKALGESSDVEGELARRQVRLYRQQARAERGLGRSEAALATYATARELGSYAVRCDARIERAELLLELGRGDEAGEELLAALKQSSSKEQVARIWLGLARVHTGRGELEQGRRRLVSCLELDPVWTVRDAAKALLAELGG